MWRGLWSIFFVILTLGTSFQALAQEEEPPIAGISDPLAGEAVQGNFSILGTTDMEGMEAWNLSFAYVNDTTDTWFLIADGNSAIFEEVIAKWNTNTITDGMYNVRLLINLDNGDEFILIVPNIRVRNYSPNETSTPTLTPTKDPAQNTATPTLTSTPYPPTPTPLPSNPVEISPSDITNNLTYGAIVAAVVFLLIGFYISIRRTFR